MPDPALSLRSVTFVRDGTSILDGIDWIVQADQRWVVLGANGSGKTTLMRIAGLWEHPSSGSVEVLGERLGHTDVRSLRRRVGLVSQAMADLVRGGLAAVDVVMTARHGALETWWHDYDADDRQRALGLLDRMGCARLAQHPFLTLSSGERQRVLLARSLMADVGLLLLDEPNAGLDLAGREALVTDLAQLAADPGAPATVLVTHHVEEIPPGFTHLLLLRDGSVLADGPLEEALTAEALSECFSLRLSVGRSGDRWHARAS